MEDRKEYAKYAGFRVRFAAMLIDVVILVILFSIPVGFIYGQEYWQGEKLIYGFWDVLINYVIPAILTIFFWIKFLGTPGKMILNLRVVDEHTGGSLSIGKAIGRYFAYIPSALPIFLGFFWIIFSDKKQAWHDILAGTVVIRSESKGPFEFSDKEAHLD